MNKVQFGEGACERVRRYFDSYISNELMIETNHEVLRHVEGCPACAAELDARTHLRTRLKSAASQQTAPPELAVKIREQIRARESQSWWTPANLSWAGATAAAVLVAVGLWQHDWYERKPALTDRPAQSVYIEKVSAVLSAALKVGIKDHIHCSVFRKYPQNPPPVERMEHELGPSYQGLLPVVKAAVPGNYRVVMAHQCDYAKRKYVHLTLRNGNDVVSLVIARKNEGESLEHLAAAAQPGGIPVYQSAADRYEVAAFDSGPFLAFVVSEMKGKANLQLAASLAPAVREFLARVSG